MKGVKKMGPGTFLLLVVIFFLTMSIAFLCSRYNERRKILINAIVQASKGVKLDSLTELTAEEKDILCQMVGKDVLFSETKKEE